MVKTTVHFLQCMSNSSSGESVCTDVSHDIHVTCMSVGRAVSKLVCVLIDWAELLVLLQYEFTNKDILAPHIIDKSYDP